MHEFISVTSVRVLEHLSGCHMCQNISTSESACCMGMGVYMSVGGWISGCLCSQMSALYECMCMSVDGYDLNISNLSRYKCLGVCTIGC